MFAQCMSMSRWGRCDTAETGQECKSWICMQSRQMLVINPSLSSFCTNGKTNYNGQ